MFTIYAPEDFSKVQLVSKQEKVLKQLQPFDYHGSNFFSRTWLVLSKNFFLLDHGLNDPFFCFKYPINPLKFSTKMK